MKEFEMKLNKEESGGQFSNFAIEEIGAKLDKLEMARKSA